MTRWKIVAHQVDRRPEGERNKSGVTVVGDHVDVESPDPLSAALVLVRTLQRIPERERLELSELELRGPSPEELLARGPRLAEEDPHEEDGKDE